MRRPSTTRFTLSSVSTVFEPEAVAAVTVASLPEPSPKRARLMFHLAAAYEPLISPSRALIIEAALLDASAMVLLEICRSTYMSTASISNCA